MELTEDKVLKLVDMISDCGMQSYEITKIITVTFAEKGEIGEIIRYLQSHCSGSGIDHLY